MVMMIIVMILLYCCYCHSIYLFYRGRCTSSDKDFHAAAMKFTQEKMEIKLI